MDSVEIKKVTGWKSVVDEWLASGLTQTEFCEQRELKVSQLSYYYRKYHPTPKSTAKLAKITCSRSDEIVSVGGFVLAFPSGVKLSVPSQFCQQSLHRLLVMLQETSC